VQALRCSFLWMCAVGLVACASQSSESDLPGDPGFGGIQVFPPSTGGGFAGGFTGGLGAQDGAAPVRLGELRTAAKSPPPISGGTLAVDKAGTVAVVADSDRDVVYIVDVTEGGVRKVKLASGSEPGRVALDGNKTAHVALRGTGKLAHIDLTEATATETAVCSHPRGVVIAAAQGRVIVSCLDGQLVQLDLTTHEEVARTTDLPSDLRDVIVGESGVEAVTRFRSAELVRLDANQKVKASTQPRKGQRFNDRPLPPMLVGDGGVVTVPPQPTTLTLSPALAWRALRAANGNVWMMHQQSQDEQVVISAGGGYGSGGCATITGGKVTELDPDGKTVRAMGVPLLGLSVDAALSANGKWLAIAAPGAYLRSSGTLQVFATTSMQTGENPGDCQVPTHSGGDENQTTAVAFDDNNVLYAYSREPAELQIFVEPQVDTSNTSTVGRFPVGLFGGSNGQRLTRKASIALDLSSMRDTGHDLFHADVGQGIACASCHGEALDDAHVWNFEMIGPRRTQNMRGGLLGTAPFHWDGDMMSINHLVDEVMTRRMGGFQVMKPFADALGGWIDRQPALTVPAGDAAAVARGKTLFAAAGTQCSTCHSGKNFTNNESKDVGTGGTFQVPGLLGLSLRAPYMHNGCAATLEGRFVASCGGGDKHGVTSNLSASQIGDLVAYLKTL
jgi:mono/diheme cytochrome c family protein